jgi:hypothetical protein
MSGYRRRLTSVIGLLVVLVAAPAAAQENLDSGKTPAQLFASDCVICHKSAQGLGKSAGMLGLENFLRQHYTASRESAAAISAYLQAMDKGPPPAPDKRTKRSAKGSEQVKGSGKKPAEAKGSESKSSDAKPAEAKPTEAKPTEAKPAEAKPTEAKPTEAKPTEAKPSEDKSSETKSGDAKPAASKPVETKPSEPKLGEPRPSEPKPSEPKSDEAKSDEAKPASNAKPDKSE